MRWLWSIIADIDLDHVDAAGELARVGIVRTDRRQRDFRKIGSSGLYFRA